VHESFEFLQFCSETQNHFCSSNCVLIICWNWKHHVSVPHILTHILLSSDSLGIASQTVALRAGESMVTVALPPVDGASVRLWWPAGMGEQALYSIAVSAQVVAANANANGNGNNVATPTVEATRRVGFRVVYLVTTDDASPAAPTAEGCVPFQYRGHFDSCNQLSH
jgi:hypothetical protein